MTSEEVQRETPAPSSHAPTIDRAISTAAAQAGDVLASSPPQAWNPDTLKLAFEEAQKLQPQYSEWAKAADNKVVTVFSVACGIIAVAPALHWGTGLSGWSLAFWGLALSACVAAIGSCHAAFKPDEFRVDPEPNRLWDQRWLNQPPDAYRFYRLRDMGKTHQANIEYLDRRAKKLGHAMFFTALEIAALVAAFVTHLT